MLQVEKVLTDFKPDIIHVFGTENGFGRLLKDRHRKVLFHIQGLVYPIYNLYFPVKLPRIKILFKSNVKSILQGLTPLHNHIRFRKKALRENETLRNYYYFSGRTEWDHNYIKLRNPDAIYFHCNEILREPFYSNQWNHPNKNPNSKFIITSTMNPSFFKGIDVIYKAMDLLNDKNIEWRIVGVEKYNSTNLILNGKRKIKRNSNIVFLGQLNETDLISKLKETHLFIHPSYIDNSPNSVCEAMILGIPVLCSYVGGNRSLIKHNNTGLLFNPNDPCDLAGQITQIMANYSWAVNMGINARKVATERHNKLSIINELERIYETIKKS